MQKLYLTIIGLIICCTSQTLVNSEPPTQYGPIEMGDRLWDIAGKVRPADSSVTRYQVMFALFKANTQAFRVPCNIHSLLIIGRILQIPSIAEMQVVSHQEAVAAFNQQLAVWQNRRTQMINCSPDDKSREKPVEQETLQHPPIEIEKEVQKPTPIIVIAESEQEVSKVPSTPPEFTSTFSLPFSAIISLSVVASLFFLALFVGWLLHRYVPPQDQTENTPPPLQKAEEETESVAEPLDMLNQARACLAQGDTQTAKTYLNTIINQGFAEQQQEARQLLEITLQMSTLELRATQNQQEKPSEKTTSEVLTKTQHLPVPHYLLEDDARLSEFVSKIFTFIDHELNAQGKLAATYHKMDNRSDIHSEDYQVMETETSEDEQKKSRTRKPTRYL